MNKIAAIIITYNRLELFKKVLNGVRKQTRTPDAIIIVNNDSTDGTADFLKEQNGLIVINQSNTGSSGGQFSGIKKAYEMGFDYIWTMDDDVIPDVNCLKEMEKYFSEDKIIAPLRRNLNGEIYYNDTLKVNLSNPFKSLWSEILNPNIELTETIAAEGITFEGPAFHRSLIKEIGLPEEKFFIYGDDTEFFLRSLKEGYKQYLVPSAILERQIEPPKDLKTFNWKSYYELRNIIAIDVLHGNFAVRMLRPVAYFLDRIIRVKSLKHFRVLVNAFVDGYFYKSEN